MFLATLNTPQEILIPVHRTSCNADVCAAEFENLLCHNSCSNLSILKFIYIKAFSETVLILLNELLSETTTSLQKAIWHKKTSERTQ